ncbi:16S rRNA (cytosine(1402)-N(4))-methyltransferase, partial [Klebsiella pneumoniae]|nr:16S rRNA (cytosine(1402)-N(4))-methyltransferase [Klebsiella pneumoniae]
QRMAGDFAVEADLRADVALVVFEPHGGAGDEDGKFVYFDAVKLFQTALDGLGIGKVDGALFDLGISSPQIDDGSRGFSFRFDAPLDMRMDTTRGMSAAEWIAVASEQDLHEVIKNYVEERFSRQIARAIVAQRAESPIDTTRKLAQIVAQNVR